MTPSQQLSRARNSVRAYCQQHFPEETLELRDSIFIHGGFYRGRRFRCDQVSAVWFAEEDQLKIHTLDGACVANWDAAEMDTRVAQLNRLKQIDAANTEGPSTEGPSTLPMIAAEAQPATQVEIRQIEIRRAA